MLPKKKKIFENLEKENNERKQNNFIEDLPKNKILSKNLEKENNERKQNNFYFPNFHNQPSILDNNNYYPNIINNQINMENIKVNFSFGDNVINNIKNENRINTEPLKSSIFPVKMKKCEICLEEFDEYGPLNYELKCGCIIHNICFDNYIKNSVLNNNIPIKCPNCKKEVHPNFIYDSLRNSKNKKLVKKYEKFSMNNYLMNHKDSYSCCPTPGCEYMFCFEGGENHFICPLCNNEYCLFCKNEWHKGMTCQEYKDSKDENKLDEKFKEFAQGQNYKICPKCKFWVEKTEGCNHMKCRCGADFCYKCGKFTRKPLNDCPCWGNEEDDNTVIAFPPNNSFTIIESAII